MAEPPKKRQRSEAESADTLIICAGDESQEFTVYNKKLRKCSSTFLKATLSHDWKQVPVRRIVIRQTTSLILDVYIHWMHTAIFVFWSTGCNDRYIELIELYLLGDHLNDLPFCKTIVDFIVAQRYKCNALPNETCIDILCKRTSPACALRKVIKELWLTEQVDTTIALFHNAKDPEYPQIFIFDLFTTLSKRHPDIKDGTYSGKTRAEVESACNDFVKTLEPKGDN